MTFQQDIAPVEGSWVIAKVGEGREQRPGQVRKVMRANGRISLSVGWLVDGKSDVVSLDQVENGLRPGYEVWHVPEGGQGTSLGLGTVIAQRTIGARQQLLVDFPATGQRFWMPWQRFRFAKGPAFRFLHGDRGGSQAAERFRLRNLAYALELWNENTGALSRFDIDPLPHQIHLVHHILGSGNLNWLIADDVGLGKTIEAGLLVAALRQRGVAKRILVVVPAGLTRQWQEDLKFKFGLDDFRIYGADFQISDNAHWKLYDRVIASLDKIKGVDHLQAILAAERWDMVIFDEAHRLTRRQWGNKFERSDRFRLAEALRGRTDNMMLMSATPHQGRTDQFGALLELLRPEWKEAFENLELDSSVLSRMLFRNRKSDVTDIDGNFVFHGQTSRMVQVRTSPELREMERQLRAYLKQGYDAAELKGGQQAKAIGFVMTVYRKLAASSIVTLRKALVRRLARLQAMGAAEVAESIGIDERYVGEWEEVQQGSREEFFAGEVGRLKTLIEECAVASEDDDKMHAFLDQIIVPILDQSPGEHVLIFTEYRGTQDYIVECLSRRYGAGKVHVVNGSMDVEERRQSIARFEAEGQFLVSTEAGGEGINLHRRCHMLVNYDLPWNPMRLAQRIGRLYRYGQKEHVLAFNLHGVESADDIVVAKMYERLEQVAKDMAPVYDATSQDLVSDIVGDLAALVDVESILEEARDAGVRRTEERIEEALRRAKTSSELQRDLFQHAVSYDANELQGSFAMRVDHLRSFVFGMLALLGGSVRESRQYAGHAWRLALPDAIAHALPGQPREPLVTFDRQLVAPGAALLDLDSALVRYLLEQAKHYDFQGMTAPIAMPDAAQVATAMLRWQDDRGRRLRQEFVAVGLSAKGPRINPPEFSDWLLHPASASDAAASRDENARSKATMDARFDEALARRVSADLHPENREWISAAWCGDQAVPETEKSTALGARGT